MVVTTTIDVMTQSPADGPPATVAERVRAARVARGLGSRELARLAGLGEGHVATVEGRVGHAVEVDTMVKLAAALRVSLDWLITGKGEGPSAPIVAIESADEADAPPGAA